ncbi:MAG: hypothetical protein BWK78_05940 [Thiotrichaceae bacterium IS1]|nr:MAG: hypothetical protein BWK78_05940 [Thiotrichaceae bacterium IS1]
MQWDAILVQVFNPAIFAAVVWLVGMWLEKRIFQRMEEERQFGQLIMDQRLKVYHETAPLLNDLLCFYTRVGCWKDLTPPQILKIKRQLDRTIHIARPLFSDPFFVEYQAFIGLCFEMYLGKGENAKLRCKLENYRDFLVNWQSEWEPMFTSTDKATKSENIHIAYERLMSIFASELGLKRITKKAEE